MKRALLALLFVLMMLPNMLQAQSEYVSLQIVAYGSLPNGDFGEKIGDNPRLTRRAGFDVGNKVGLAQSGFGLGFELDTPVLMNGLEWVISLRYLANSTDGSRAEAQFERFMGDSVDLIYETGAWSNIPVMTGFRYKYQISSNFGAAIFLQSGINLAKAGSRTGTIGDITGEETTFEFARDFGYEIGLNIELFKKWNLGFSYLALDTPRFEGTRKLSEKVFPQIFSRENEIVGEARSISMFLVSLGYHLF